jgi:hypothetical protein
MAARDTFPMRFKSPRLREAVRHLAERTGTTMTDVMERAVEHELALQGADLERRLSEALEVVRSYSAADDASRYIAAAAAGERSGLDPMRDARAVHALGAGAAGGRAADPYGVLAAFDRG